MPTRPNNRTLLIPGKYGFTADRYRSDMQTLEMWARQPIQQLIAGSGITLTPASGLATDSKGNGPNPITISASGGGGGTAPGILTVLALPPTGVINLVTYLSESSASQFGNVDVDIWSNPPVGSLETFGSGWLFPTANSGQSLITLPEFIAPAFTGGPLTVTVNIAAQNGGFGGVTYRMLAQASITLTTGQDYQTLNTDFTVLSSTAGMSIVAGSGHSTNNGIVYGGATANVTFWVGCYGDISVPSPTTITPGP